MITNTFRSTFFFILLASVQASAGNAPQEIKPEKRALIKELFEVTRAGKLAQSTTDTLLSQMESNLPQIISQAIDSTAELKDSDREELRKTISETAARFQRRMKELMSERINLAEITEQMFYPLYDKFFSEDELRGLLSFYRSPVGQKSIEVMPALLKEAVQKSSEMILPKLMPIITQVLEEEKQSWIKRAGKKNDL